MSTHYNHSIFVLLLLSTQVVAVHCNHAKPRTADVNENVLSEVARNQFGLTEYQIKSGQPLENIIEEVTSCHSIKHFNKPVNDHSRFTV